MVVVDICELNQSALIPEIAVLISHLHMFAYSTVRIMHVSSVEM